MVAAILAATTFAPTRPLQYADTTTTAGMVGLMTVIQGLYRDFQIPAFLMEQRISYNQKLGHLPRAPTGSLSAESW